jgi:hypothetical protein
MRAVGYSRCLLCSALCALAACLAAAPSHALEPGVHADPGSPAEKEYVLPLDQARGTGREASSSSHSSSPHLFGAGIKPPRGGAGGGGSGGGTQPSSTAGAGKGGAERAGGATGGAAAGGRGSTVPDAALRASRSRGSSGNGSLLALIGGGIAILVAGAFGGTVLRHSRRATPSSGRPTPTR